MAGNGLVRAGEVLSGGAGEATLKHDLVNQQVFTGFIERIRKADALPLRDLTPYLAHDGRPSTNLAVHFEGPGDSVFLSDNFYQYVEHDAFPDRLSFDAQPVLRMGREDSRRQVFFGALRAKWFNSGEAEVRQIAVTPFPDDESSSITRALTFHEVAMYQHLGKLGIPTLEVLGVSVFEKAKSNIGGFVVTRLVPDLTTLDTLEWDQMSNDETEQYLGIALDTIAMLNSELAFHGDPQFKNICFGEAKNNIIVADLEFGTSALDVPENISALCKCMAREFSLIRASVNDFIIGRMPRDQRPQDDIQHFEFMHNKVYEPYFERLVHIGSPYIDVLTKAYDLFIRQQEASARGDAIPHA
jgi:hypothetical protein